MTTIRPRQTAFSLVELLVVIGIIVVLLALLVPVLGGALKMARASACQAKLRQWGNAYQMYLSNNRARTIPEQTNEETTLLWWEALAPYHGNVPAGLLCPEAASPRDTSSRPSVMGAAAYAWRRQTFAAPKPQRAIRGNWVGSYGFNTWVYAPANPGEMQRHYIHFPVAEATRIPLIGDCSGTYTVCTSSDPVPLNLQGAEEVNVSPAGLAAYCIDRHRMAVNIVFLEGHVERVPLAGLWKLKWSEAFQAREVVIPRKS